MKTTSLAPLSVLVFLGVPASALALAPVSRATIYPDRAMITRALDSRCDGAATPVTFTELPVNLDTSTLRAAVSGPGARVEGVSVQPRALEASHAERLRALDERLEAIDARIRTKQRDLERTQVALARAESLRTSIGPFLTREAAAERKPNLQAWSDGLDTTRALADKANAEQIEVAAALRELQREREELQRQRAVLDSSGAKQVLDAEVMLRCEGNGAVRVELSYFVGGVRWVPQYEARADAAHGKVELSTLGEVTQATGEDWTGVELTLSTATSRRDATPPELQRLYVGATPTDERKKVLVRRDERVRHVESFGAEGGEGSAAAADQGLSVNLPVPAKSDLPGDGRPVRVLVQKLPLDANFGLLAIPKLVPHVFRSAEMRNTAAWPLLPGRVDLFSQGAYLGSTHLDAVPRGDTLRLAFGIDENVKVRRVVLAEQSRDPGLLGSNRRLVYAYRIELASASRAPTEVTVQEHVPVAQFEDVSVAIEAATTAGYDLVRDDGILTWKVKLAPREKRELELHFAVAIPEKYDSSGL